MHLSCEDRRHAGKPEATSLIFLFAEMTAEHEVTRRIHGAENKVKHESDIRMREMKHGISC